MSKTNDPAINFESQTTALCDDIIHRTPQIPPSVRDNPTLGNLKTGDDSSFVLGIRDGKGPRCYILREGMYSIGRCESNAISIPNRYVSRRHAYLIRVPSPNEPCDFTYCLVDGNRKGGNSTNGVVVNGERIATHYLVSGDVIQFGPKVFGYFFSVASVQSLESQAKRLSKFGDRQPVEQR